jgi:hypothetical protein
LVFRHETIGESKFGGGTCALTELSFLTNDGQASGTAGHNESGEALARTASVRWHHYDVGGREVSIADVDFAAVQPKASGHSGRLTLDDRIAYLVEVLEITACAGLGCGGAQQVRFAAPFSLHDSFAQLPEPTNVARRTHDGQRKPVSCNKIGDPSAALRKLF